MSNNKWGSLVNAQKAHMELEAKGVDTDAITSYFFLYDCYENQIIFVNKYFELITGYSSSLFSVEFLLSIIHPDDLEYFFECEKQGLDFTNGLLFNDHFKFIINFSYRIRIANGTFITICQQCQGIEVNTSGHLTKTLVHHKVIPNYDIRPNNDYKIYDKTKNIFVDANNCFNLTKRELDIVSHVRDGYSSEQIAEQLCLSKNTIITHRRNILNKTNCSSFFELFKKMRLEDHL